MGGFPSGQRGQTVNLLHLLRWFESTTTHFVAGWSSLEARRAHNPEVIGSNPIPATRAQLAQLVEQRTENPRVLGSIPRLGTYFLPEAFASGFFLYEGGLRKKLFRSKIELSKLYKGGFYG